MKKYLFIIIPIIILVLIILGICLYPKQEDNTYYPENESNNIVPEIETEVINTTPTVEENIPSAETEIKIEVVKDNLSVAKDESKKDETSTSATTKPKQSTTTKSSSNTSKSESTKKVDEKPKEEKQQTTVNVDTPSKVETPKTETIKEEPEVKQEVERCTTDTNHFMQPGNCGKWFNTKAEAIKYYEDKLIYWDEWWKNTNSPEDDAIYYKNCPSGYEIWSCAYCSKWTINMYYR